MNCILDTVYLAVIENILRANIKEGTLLLHPYHNQFTEMTMQFIRYQSGDALRGFLHHRLSQTRVHSLNLIGPLCDAFIPRVAIGDTMCDFFRPVDMPIGVHTLSTNESSQPRGAGVRLKVGNIEEGSISACACGFTVSGQSNICKLEGWNASKIIIIIIIIYG